jgi:hypothetical protein
MNSVVQENDQKLIVQITSYNGHQLEFSSAFPGHSSVLFIALWNESVNHGRQTFLFSLIVFFFRQKIN